MAVDTWVVIEWCEGDTDGSGKARRVVLAGTSWREAYARAIELAAMIEADLAAPDDDDDDDDDEPPEDFGPWDFADPDCLELHGPADDPHSFDLYGPDDTVAATGRRLEAWPIVLGEV